MVFYTKIIGNKTPAGTQAEMERVFGNGARASGGSRSRPMSSTATKTPVPIEVKKPRVSREMIAARKQSELAQAGETRRLEAERIARERREAEEEKRQRDDALAIMKDSSHSITARIAAAAIVGFVVIRRGPQDRPRKIIFRKGDDCYVYAFPKGKNARRELQNPSWRAAV